MFRNTFFRLFAATIGLLILAFSSIESSQGRADAQEIDQSNVAAADDVLVICPERFQPALQKWIKYRTSQGHSIKVLSPALAAAGVKKQIRDVAAKGTLKHVFLVGDSGDSLAQDRDLVPTDYVTAKVNVKFGSEPEIATDHTYVDFDNDGIQDLSIGLLPVDSIAEIEQFCTGVIGGNETVCPYKCFQPMEVLHLHYLERPSRAYDATYLAVNATNLCHIAGTAPEATKDCPVVALGDKRSTTRPTVKESTPSGRESKTETCVIFCDK